MYTVKIGHPNSYLYCHRLIVFANSLYPDQTQQKKVAPDLDPNCFPLWSWYIFERIYETVNGEYNQKTTTATTTKKFVSIQKELKGNYFLIILKFRLYQPDVLQAKRCSSHAF